MFGFLGGAPWFRAAPSQRSTARPVVLAGIVGLSAVQAEATKSFPRSAETVAGSAASGKLSWQEAKKRIRVDPPPKELTRGKHYVVSDERRHDLFKDAVSGAGGLMVGVGTNQNYAIAAWADPEYLIIVDFDQVVVDLHTAYRIAFVESETPKAFFDFWKRSHRKKAYQLIEQKTAEGPQRVRALAVFKRYRGSVRWALGKVLERMKAHKVSTFLDDPAQYDVVRRLFQQDRVLAVRGDFTARRTLTDIGEVAQAMGVPVRVLYLSNIEQYFPWTRGAFAENMLGLPFDEHSVVLRAYGWGRHRTADHNYRYYVQSGDNFRMWLEDPKTRSAAGLFKSEQPSGIVGFHELTMTPEAFWAKQKKRAAARRRSSRGS